MAVNPKSVVILGLSGNFFTGQTAERLKERGYKDADLETAAAQLAQHGLRIGQDVEAVTANPPTSIPDSPTESSHQQELSQSSLGGDDQSAAHGSDGTVSEG